MGIPQSLADQLLVKCGRCCCVCRRFEPLHLQVHHIVEQAEGGTDDADNLIAVCLTCHSDIHTKTLLTRRFTITELKGHREALIGAVASGRMPQNRVGPDDLQQLVEDTVTRVRGQTPPPDNTSKSLSAGGMRMLLGALETGHVADMSEVVHSGLTADDIREMSRSKRHLDELLGLGLLRYVGGILYFLTDEGFLLADQALAASQE